MIPITIETPWDPMLIEAAVDEAIREGRTKIKKSSMRLGPYNGFSGDTRLEADRKIKVAIALGLIPKPEECSVCSGRDGRIDYHGENYGRPLEVVPICQSCHLALHNRFRSKGFAESWLKRVQRFDNGTKWYGKLKYFSESIGGERDHEILKAPAPVQDCRSVEHTGDSIDFVVSCGPKYSQVRIKVKEVLAV